MSFTSYVSSTTVCPSLFQDWGLTNRWFAADPSIYRLVGDEQSLNRSPQDACMHVRNKSNLLWCHADVGQKTFATARRPCQIVQWGAAALNNRYLECFVHHIKFLKATDFKLYSVYYQQNTSINNDICLWSHRQLTLHEKWELSILTAYISILPMLSTLVCFQCEAFSHFPMTNLQ